MIAKDIWVNVSLVIAAGGIACFVGAATDGAYQRWLLYFGGSFIFISASIVIWALITSNNSDSDMKSSASTVTEKEVGIMSGDSYSNYGTNSGHIGPINNFGKPAFSLTQEIIDRIIKACPVSVPVTVIAVGSQKAFPMRDIIAAALDKAGFKVDTSSAMMIMPPAETPIQIQTKPDRTIIQINPAL
jgi:hypothetical protein